MRIRPLLLDDEFQPSLVNDIRHIVPFAVRTVRGRIHELFADIHFEWKVRRSDKRPMLGPLDMVPPQHIEHVHVSFFDRSAGRWVRSDGGPIYADGPEFHLEPWESTNVAATAQYDE